MIFAPAPQLTVTIEERGGEPDIHLHAGGQGVWQARMVTALGVPVVLCCNLGGETGQVLEPLLVEEGVELRTMAGESRNGAYVHDRRAGGRIEIAEAPGEPLNRHELDELYGITLAEGLAAPVSLLSGPADPSVLPADVYRRLAHDLTRNGAQVVADLSGDNLVAVLEGGVCFLKVSAEELVKDGRVPHDGREELVRAMFALRGEGAGAVVVSRAQRPALALLDGTAYEVGMPELEPADHRGAGDSMTAGVSAVLAQGGDLTTAVRTGAAAGAYNVTRHGLGSGRAATIGKLMEHVQLRPLDRKSEQEG